MNMKRFIITFMAGMIAAVVSVSAEDRQKGHAVEEHKILIPPVKFIAPEDKKIWEGQIDGRRVAAFRAENDNEKKEVVIVTEDDLPKYFKRIEYLDKGGDGALDLVEMNIYEKAKGWRRVGITKENKYGLGYAESQYKELLGKIKGQGK
jgi:hypothetical protein